MYTIRSSVLKNTGKRVCVLEIPAESALSKAEQIAGVRTRSLRGPQSTIIDVCTIRLPNAGDEETLCKEIADSIGSQSLGFESSYIGICLWLSFEEAHLTKALFSSLRQKGITPDYIEWSPSNQNPVFTRTEMVL